MSATEEKLDLGEAIRLFTIQSEEGQANSVIPLRWCISQQLRQLILDEGIKKPYLLLVVSNNGHEVDHYLVPLTAEMQYVAFRKPGLNIIHATVVWRAGGGKDVREEIKGGSLIERKQVKVDALREQYYKLQRERSNALSRFEANQDGEVEDLDALFVEQLQKIDNEIDELLYSEPYTPFIATYVGAARLDYEATLDVEVPKEMFAKEPNPLLKKLGTVYWESKPRDQCHLRRRAIIAGVTLPFAAVIALVGLAFVELFNLLVVGILLLLGIRGINYDAVKEPWEHAPNTTWKKLSPSRWWTKEVPPRESWQSTAYPMRSPIFAVINPPVLLALVAIVELFPHLILWVAGVAVGALVVIVLGIFAFSYSENTATDRAREARLKKEEQERRRKEALARELELLACDTRPREVSLDALPKQRRTVTLRFQDLKSRVCKPYAA